MHHTSKRGFWGILCFALLFVAASNLAWAADDFSRGLLWRIAKPAQPASFLFGTIHSEDERVLALLSEAPAKALRQADAVVIETELDEKSSAQFMSAMFFTDGQRLEHLLEPQLYQKALAAAASRGLHSQQIATIKPWALMTMLAMPVPKTGLFLDRVVYQTGAERGAKLGGLETPQEQIDAMNGLAMNDQIALLKETIERLDEMPELLEQLTKAYLDRDLGRMQQLYEEYSAQSDHGAEQRLKERILEARNDRMVERMQPWLKSGNSFIAVGALHLPGDNGLLRQLNAMGWKVELIY